MTKKEYIKAFGLKIFFVKAFRKILLKSKLKISWKINEYNEKIIEKYLINVIKKSKDEIEKIKIQPLKKEIIKDPIWVMWYQGIENAPDIVKACIESMKVNSSGHQVIVLSENNVWDYVKLPDFIIEKFENGHISRTHLSDIIRLNLLYLYGGAWLDATLLTVNPIPNIYFSKEIFSINFGKKTKDPSHGKWTTFCLFAHKGNKLIEQTLKSHYCYWMQNDYPIDYVMFDYFINYLVNKNHGFKIMIDNIPCTNEKIFDLMQEINTVYDKNNFLLKDEEEIFYKLSWKKKYIKKVNNNLTLYAKIIQKFCK